MLHIWHEDSYTSKSLSIKNKSATQQFWEFLQQNCSDAQLKTADIRGFNSCSNLHRYIATLPFNDTDTYIILMDRVLNNAKVMDYYRNTKKLVSTYSNVVLTDFLCFEYFIYDFRYFLDWIKPTDKNRLIKYKGFVDVCKAFDMSMLESKPWQHSKVLVNFVEYRLQTNASQSDYYDRLASVSDEKLITYIVSEITKLSCDFNIEKTTFGNCWTCDCANCKYVKYPSFKDKKVCNIVDRKKTSLDKAKSLWYWTKAKQLVDF